MIERRAADMEIDVARAGLLLFDDLVDVAGAARHAQLQLDAGMFVSKAGLELFSQFGAGGNGNDNVAFFSGGFDSFFPVGLRALLAGLSRRESGIQQQHKYKRDISN